MSKRKRPESVRYSVRLSRAQADRVEKLRDELLAGSDNDVFDYLVTVGTNQREDLIQLCYSLFGNLMDDVARRCRRLETVSQFHLALTDGFLKYALTALPEVPESLLNAARARATNLYEQINLTTAREFQRRRDSGAYASFDGQTDDEPNFVYEQNKQL
jgi:hypothetical protein